MLQFLVPLTVAKFFKESAADVIKFLALRALLISLISILLPLAIYAGWLLIQEQVMGYINTISTDGDLWQGNVIELTGLGAWIAGKLRFYECFAVLSTALVYRFVLGFFRR